MEILSLTITNLTISKKQIEKLRELGILDEVGARNLKIRKRFYQLKEKHPQKKAGWLLNRLSQEFSETVSNTRAIVYSVNYQKKPLKNPVDSI